MQNNENDIFTEEQPDIDYVAKIEELKANSVPKDRYQKLQSDNKKLLDALVNNKQIDDPNKQVRPSDDELRNKLSSGQCTNLDYCKAAMDLRDSVMENGGRDPFLPNGKDYIPSPNDIATTERVANIIKECIDYADGDNALFTNELQRRMI